TRNKDGFSLILFTSQAIFHSFLMFLTIFRRSIWYREHFFTMLINFFHSGKNRVKVILVTHFFDYFLNRIIFLYTITKIPLFPILFFNFFLDFILLYYFRHILGSINLYAINSLNS